MSTKFKPYDPKSLILQKLLEAPFWSHLANGSNWREQISATLLEASDNQLEQDNFRLQEELNVAMTVIANQEVKIERLESMLTEYREYRKQVTIKLDELQQLRVDTNHYSGY